MPQIIDARSNFIPGTMIGPEEEHLYTQPRPFSTLFVSGLQAILQTSPELKAKQLYIAFGQRPGTIRDARYVGVYTGRFDGWQLTVNWTPEIRDGLPPGHIRVVWSETEVAVLSPFTDGKPVDGVPSQNVWNDLALVTEDNLQEACATAIATTTKKDRLFEAFDGQRAQDRMHQPKEG